MRSSSPGVSDRDEGLAGVAKAFATYALVPYLGILFCPGAVIVGSVGAARARGASADDRRRICYVSVVAGLGTTAIQLLLWWMLYKIPEWAKGSP